MPWYKTGTVSITSGQTTVTGVSTNFSSNAKVGDGLRGPDGQWYEIVNIASSTVLGIYPAYQGTTVTGSVNWMIAPLQGYNKESADRLRAITDSFPTSLDAKQDKNVNLTALSGLTGATDRLPYFTGAGALSLAVLTAAGRTLMSGVDSAAQRTTLVAAKSGANTDITSLAGLTTPLSGQQGGTGQSSINIVFSRLLNLQALSYSEAAAERIRLKTFEPINFVVDIDDVSTAQVRGPGYVTTTTVGTKPGNGQYAYGVLETILITGDLANQKFTPLSGAVGITFPEYRRTGYGLSATRWGPWRMVIDESSALVNPSSGGIMTRTVVGGIALTKYLDGRNIANGVFTTATAVLTAGTSVVSITLPFSIGADDSFSNASVTALPSLTYDAYGVVGEYITNSGTVLNVAIRNGATAQAFKIAGTITGHWK